MQETKKVYSVMYDTGEQYDNQDTHIYKIFDNPIQASRCVTWLYDEVIKHVTGVIHLQRDIQQLELDYGQDHSDLIDKKEQELEDLYAKPPLKGFNPDYNAIFLKENILETNFIPKN
jgi:hypothetical protein